MTHQGEQIEQKTRITVGKYTEDIRKQVAKQLNIRGRIIPLKWAHLAIDEIEAHIDEYMKTGKRPTIKTIKR